MPEMKTLKKMMIMNKKENQMNFKIGDKLHKKPLTKEICANLKNWNLDKSIWDKIPDISYISKIQEFDRELQWLQDDNSCRHMNSEDVGFVELVDESGKEFDTKWSYNPEWFELLSNKDERKETKVEIGDFVRKKELSSFEFFEDDGFMEEDWEEIPEICRVLSIFEDEEDGEMIEIGLEEDDVAWEIPMRNVDILKGNYIMFPYGIGYVPTGSLVTIVSSTGKVGSSLCAKMAVGAIQQGERVEYIGEYGNGVSHGIVNMLKRMDPKSCKQFCYDNVINEKKTGVYVADVPNQYSSAEELENHLEECKRIAQTTNSIIIKTIQENRMGLICSRLQVLQTPTNTTDILIRLEEKFGDKCVGTVVKNRHGKFGHTFIFDPEDGSEWYLVKKDDDFE